MTLQEVLRGVRTRDAMAPPLAARPVMGLAYDSRKVEKDYMFFAFQGARADGRQFAQTALERGATAVVSELPRPPGFTADWIEVEHGRKALALAARNFYAERVDRIQFTGITGTNGKTTTAYVIDAILRSTGVITGMIGTIEYRLAEDRLKALNTTPESLDVLEMAAQLQQRGGTHLTMEVSSHALALARVYGLPFHTAVFTNLTRDHLDFHHTMEEYAAAKRLLFAPEFGPAPEWVILNVDDLASAEMTPPAASRVLTYGVSLTAAVRAGNIRSGFDGLYFDLFYDGQKQAIHSPLIGRVNISNLLAAAGVGISYGMDLASIAQGIAECPAVPGRFERVCCGQPFWAVVDFAHTDDALRSLIQVARELTQQAGGGRVITVFGCGGDRDRSKRPLMGMAAGELSDFVVLTSDNPRSEDPLGIMNDAMVGLGRFETPRITEPDRAKAIRRALEEAKPGDVVLLAGKGHETYQVLKDRTIDFDDRETARQILHSLGYKQPG